MQLGAAYRPTPLAGKWDWASSPRPRFMILVAGCAALPWSIWASASPDIPYRGSGPRWRRPLRRGSHFWSPLRAGCVMHFSSYYDDLDVKCEVHIKGQ